MHLTLKRLEAPGSLEVWCWGWSGDILVETGGEMVMGLWDFQQSWGVGLEGNKIWNVRINK